MAALHVVFEKSEWGYGAYVPALPGCVAIADTLPEAKRLVCAAIAERLQALAEAGDDTPLALGDIEGIIIEN